ncbi:MAG: rmlC [Burkholderiaceae bacterium]|nr:rmlC [Burkholderiaceae bacterium]
MKVLPADLSGVLLIEPDVYPDARGWFFESFNQRHFSDATGLDVRFVQDNISHSAKNVVRGLHYQIRQPQGKLVTVLAGEIRDVVVDLRQSSRTFGHWFGVTLSAENRRQLWVPPGFAHGFAVTGESADVLYKVTDYWAPQHERCLRWNDPALGIDWQLPGAAILSDKDGQGALLAAAEVFD